MDCEGDINKLIDQIFDFTINEDLTKPLIDKSESSHDSNDLKDYLYSKIPSESSYESDESEIEFIEIILDDEKSYSNSINDENESNDNEIDYSDDNILYESEDDSNSGSDDEN